jgi:hypothetical protein
LQVDVPLYDKNKQLNVKTKEELKSMWDIAKSNIAEISDEERGWKLAWQSTT